jgi:putative ABC transport system substrate-binding protein
MPYLKRRDFIMLVGGATAAWPLSARAQQSLPVIGFLHAGSPGERVHLITALREGLRARGYLEGENVIIDYRWAEDQFDRLPALAAELVRRRASVIATPAGTVAALAAKKATTTIPIIFGGEAHPDGCSSSRFSSRSIPSRIKDEVFLYFVYGDVIQ